MRLVVGLGNPGRKYLATRHNIGFDVVEELARRGGATGSRAQFQGETAEVNLAGERVLLLQPQTFMNLSGSSVLAARDFYKLGHDEILIICDDFHLPVGKLRVRPRGSDGGQKGLGDVIRRLSTDEVPRLRIGVGPLPDGWDAASYVLGRFAPDDKSEAKCSIQLAAEAVAVWVEFGMDQCMNQYN